MTMQPRQSDDTPSNQLPLPSVPLSASTEQFTEFTAKLIDGLPGWAIVEMDSRYAWAENRTYEHATLIMKRCKAGIVLSAQMPAYHGPTNTRHRLCGGPNPSISLAFSLDPKVAALRTLDLFLPHFERLYQALTAERCVAADQQLTQACGHASGGVVASGGLHAAGVVADRRTLEATASATRGDDQISALLHDRQHSNVSRGSVSW